MKICVDPLETAKVPFSRRIDNQFTTQNLIWGVLSHPSLNYLYFMAQHKNNGTNSIYTDILMTDFEINTIVMKSIKADPPNKEKGISQNGDYLYILFGIQKYFMEFNSTDLSITAFLSIPDKNYRDIGSPYTAGDDSSDPAVVYMDIVLDTADYWSVCKWKRTETQMTCLNYGQTSNSINFKPINSDLVFMNMMRTGSSNLYYTLLNFSSNSFNWSKYTQCTTDCSLDRSDSAISSDGGFLYVASSFGNRVLFHVLDLATGEPKNSGLIASGFANYCNDIEEVEGSNIVLILEDTTNTISSITVIDKEKSTVKKEFLQSGITTRASQKIIVSGQEVLVIGGQISMVHRMIRTPVGDIGRLSYFTERSSIFSTITTEGVVESFPSDLPAMNSLTPSMTVEDPSTLTITTEVTSDYAPDYLAYINKEDYVKSFIANNYIEEEISLGCTYQDDSSSMSFAVTQLDGESVPNWVHIDFAEQLLYLNKTPDSDKDTLYKFSILINYQAESVTKNFYLTIKQCDLDNCNVCQKDDPQKCDECNVGYSLNESTRQCERESAEAYSTSAKVIMGTSIALAVFTSLVTMSSPVGIFSMVNQFQLYILLPLLPPYFPAKVGDFILGMDFSAMSFNFIPTYELPVIKDTQTIISDPQDDSYLEEIGLKSRSTVTNYS
ncbi:unnamed protein product [Moneuplotes crassus]|uniref:Uncharacterized protein n=1 Tax=Euplotes crassus TaxID=5936 RepID=A0AAD1YB69_EUPCR|nr:unnamed protein product [Moneuplotes crassus]